MKVRKGSIEVICGCMFCGKTEELIRRCRRLVIAKQCFQVFSPDIDNRRGLNRVTSHNGMYVDSISVACSKEILGLLHLETVAVAIDEVQFFDEEIVDIVETLARKKIRVIMAGLDTNFRGEPFGPMPQLLSIAEDVSKLQAICTVCGEDACRTQRLVNGRPAKYEDPIILIGAAEKYEARCRDCHTLLL